MTVHLLERGVRCVVLDIEGTTTPVSFVTDALFPFARANLREYLTAHFRTPEVQESMRLLQAEWALDRMRGENPPQPVESPPAARFDSFMAYITWLMDRDRKSPGLKRLQGLIWKRGYEAGSLRGEVFTDIPGAFDRWRSAGIDIAIYSSGSVLAQRLLFGSTAAGDLTPRIRSFFDGTIGPKVAPASYTSIAEGLGLPGAEVLFVSDALAELTAASEAGLQAILCVRPGNPVQPANPFATVQSFDEIVA